MEILDANGFDSEIGISNLIDKSLLTIDSLDGVDMHDLLQKMGHKIVERESRCPGERSRLWHHNDIYHVLRGNTGADKIEYISLDFSKIKEINLNRNAFSKMQSLRFLDFSSHEFNGYDSSYCECLLVDQNIRCSYCLLNADYKVKAPQGLKFDSTYLSHFRWLGYPLPSLPSNFDMENLVALIMPGSKIKQLWNGQLYLDKLRHLNLAHSKDLIGIPELSMTPNLESLSLEGCTSLIKVPSSIQYLNKLVILNLKGCKSLSSLPTYIQSKFLRYLILSGCSSLEMAPKITCCMERVYLDGTSIIELPLTECPSRLEYLNLEDCSRLESLPSIICEIKSLGSLCVSGCSKLHNLPKDLGKLESLFKLTANNTSIRKLPCSMLSLNKLRMLCLGGYRGEDLLVDSVWPFLLDLGSLEDLDLSDCQITRLPDSVGQLSSLRNLNLSRNNFEWMPLSIQQLFSLCSLNISYCERLKNLPKLPWRCGLVNAYNCVSLESFNTDSILSADTVNLGNCVKLDQNMLKSMLKKEHCGGGGFCFPGNEFPDWFTFQNVGFSITLEMPPLDTDKIQHSWLNVCLVVTFPELDKAPQSLAVRCKLIGIGEYGKRQEIGVGQGTTEFQCNSLRSDHVILAKVYPMVWGCPKRGKTEWRYVNLDFGGENYNVKKCGAELRFYGDCVHWDR